jgi:two-component system CheB/CheR fusion protein
MASEQVRRGLDGVRVLFVEDVDDVRDLIAFLLRSEGAEVRTVPCARAAIEAAAAWDFDVLLTDLGLPDVSGDHLIREILGMKAPRPRVVVVTGFSEPHITRAKRAGADVVFTKPLEWTDLRDQLVPSDVSLVA